MYVGHGRGGVGVVVLRHTVVRAQRMRVRHLGKRGKACMLCLFP